MIRTFASSIAVLAVTSSMAFADGHSLEGKTWEEIVAQAQEEGEVVFANWFLQPEMREAVSSFEEEYGITVVIPDGTNDAFGAKVLAEAGNDVGDIDVFPRGFNEFEVLDLEGLFVKLDALPEDDGRVTSLVGVDGQGFAVAYWGNQTGISYDPAQVSEADLPQSAEELAAFWAANPEKFGFNYENGGSGPSFYQNVIREVTGIDLTDGDGSDERMAELAPGFEYFLTHSDNYIITSSNADTITRISDGELWMGPGWEDHVAGLQNRGEIRDTIKFYVPEFGMNGGGNGVVIPQNAPNPAAALVFVDWLTSAETQSMFNANFGTAPMHAEADDSAALVPNEQRAFRQPWGAQPLRGQLDEAFVENVVLER